mmetsp:Transcript_27530/g.56392  ORF Transcript_27530/g.56392 Transcript_27530/m.56392 type:complete len:443 (+) Transcript_27530:1644-2972(+)
MAHNNRCHISERVEVVLHPRHIDHIEMVGRLIQKQNISLLKHGTSKCKLHAPSTRKRRHGMIRLGLAIFSEAYSGQHIPDLLHVNVHRLDLFVNKDVLDTRKMGLLTLNISLDEDGPDLSHIRETFNLVVRNGSHESCLSRIISTKKTITLTALKLHLGVVQKNLGTIGKSELAVAQLLSIILLIILVRDLKHFFSLSTDSLNGCLSSLLIEEALELRHQVLCPLKIKHVVQIHHACCNFGAVGNNSVHGLGSLTTDVLLELNIKLADISTHREGLVRESLQPLELFHCLLSGFTGLWVSNGAGVGLQCRKEERKERSRINGVVDQFRHVVDDDSTLTLGRSLLLTKTTEEEGDDHSKRGALHTLHKGDTSHNVHDLRNLLGLRDCCKDLASHVLNIPVADDFTRSLHGRSGSSLNLLLSVPHTGSDLRNNLRKRITKLLGG